MKITTAVVRIRDTADMNRTQRGLPAYDAKRLKRVVNIARAAARKRNKK